VIGSEDQGFLPRTSSLGEPRPAIRLTPDGFQALAENFPNLIPDQPREKIEDKSKGDAMTKAIVCFQCKLHLICTSNLLIKTIAAWFCTQCVVRLGLRVGISLLELNTLGHALCAFLIYCLWWDKPLDTKEPEQLFLKKEDELQLMAALCAKSSFGDRESEWVRWHRDIRVRMNLEPARKGTEFSRPELFRKLLHTRRIRKPEWGGNMDSVGSHIFFPVVSSGPGSRRWVVGLGKEKASPEPTTENGGVLLLQSEGWELKS
jgi:hypothetical protein